MNLFWHPAGLKVSYHRDAFREWLEVEDLNPEQRIEFAMTPVELLGLGFKCIWAAIWHGTRSLDLPKVTEQPHD